MRPTLKTCFWVEFRVGRINWSRFLAFVATLNDVNIYFDSKIVALGMMILAICNVWDAFLAKYWRLCLSNAILMELGVVPFIWEHILVIVPILNDGIIYETENVNFWDTLLHLIQKRLRSVWSRCDEILRVGRRNDMHWTANDRSSSMHQKSASNSLWKHLYGSIFVWGFQTIFRSKKVHKTQWKTHFSIKSKNIVFKAIFGPF